MVAAIKAAQVWPWKLAEGCCDLIAHFPKGDCRVTPYHIRPAVPPWDLEVVLSALQQEPFEPLETVGPKWLSLKLAFLLAIVSAKRMGDLHALSLHEECCCLLLGDAGVVLCPNPAFHPKVLFESHTSQSIELHPFHPPKDGDTELWIVTVVPCQGLDGVPPSDTCPQDNRPALCLPWETSHQDQALSLGCGCNPAGV